MSAMRWLAFILVAAACSKEGAAPNILVAKTKAIVDKACACPDAACVTAIEAEWNVAVGEGAATKLSADDVEALAAETKRFSTCVEESKRKGAR